MDTIKELMRGRTTLIVTHRIATIHGMDKIVVLEHGPDRRTRHAARNWSRAAASTPRSTPPEIILVRPNDEQRQLRTPRGSTIGGRIRSRRMSNSAKASTARPRRFSGSSKTSAPRAVVIGDHVSCYAGCSFAIGVTRHLLGRRFHPAQRRAPHGRGTDRDRFALPDLVERRHRRFRFSSARA